MLSTLKFWGSYNGWCWPNRICASAWNIYERRCDTQKRRRIRREDGLVIHWLLRDLYKFSKRITRLEEVSTQMIWSEAMVLLGPLLVCVCGICGQMHDYSVKQRVNWRTVYFEHMFGLRLLIFSLCVVCVFDLWLTDWIYIFISKTGNIKLA